jgi:arylsulfatase
LYADDLGYGDLGCYGSKIETPNIDDLAAEGARFTHFCSASSVCSPARASLLTGRYPVRTGVMGVLGPDDTGGLPESEVTLGQLLRREGYRTACIGKWHLGARSGFLPTDRGFERFFGLPYSHDMWPRPLMHNHEVIESPARVEKLTPMFTDSAKRFLTDCNQDPFFLYLPYTAPHIPLAAGPRFRGRAGDYGATLRELDWSVGEIVRAVDEAGLGSNTLILLTSDNGPWYQGSAGALRGRKRETLEGGVRVPLIARMPGTVPAGIEQSGFATAMDLLPTIARFTGAHLPGNPLDGVDIWPMLTGEDSHVDREVFLYFDHLDIQCARLGPWKLHVTRYNSPHWVPSPAGGRVSLPLRPELYYLPDDPSESYDVSGEYPAAVSQIRERIEAVLPTFPAYVQWTWNDTMARKTEWTPAGALPIQRVQ